MSDNIVRYRISSLKKPNIEITKKDKSFNIAHEDINFTVSLRLEWIDKESTIRNHCTIAYLSKVDDETLLTMKFAMDYLIKDYHLHVTKKDSSIETTDTLLIEMFSTTVNTARGYLYAKTEDTYLNNVVLGTFNPISIINTMKAEASS